MRYTVVLCILLASFFGEVFAQNESATAPRTVQLEPSLPRDLVKVVRVMLDGVEVKPGIPFQAGDDWFNQLKVVVKNLSTKKIIFVAGQLRFPETGDTTAEHPAAMDRISIGQRPDHVTGRRFNDVPSAPILVGPAQEISVPAADNFDRVKTAIEGKQPLSSLTKCAVGITTLYFDDGTMWVSGVYLRADPSTPGRYVRISRKEFEAYSQEAPQ